MPIPLRAYRLHLTAAEGSGKAEQLSRRSIYSEALELSSGEATILARFIVFLRKHEECLPRLRKEIYRWLGRR